MKKLSSLLLVVSLATFGCSSTTKADLKSAGSTAVNDAIDCTKPELLPVVAALIPTIEALFTGAPANWQQTTDTVVAALGDAGKCAVKQVLDQLSVKLAGAMKPGQEVDLRPFRRGQNYLSTKNWKFKD